MLVGLIGASGSGKTYSALRLATGMQRVTGGEIFYVDTEARRALHYADEFNFRHVEMNEPFSPMDYLEAIKFCSGKGAKILIIDSMSHEHEGPGGVLAMHDAELDRLCGNDNSYSRRNKMTMLAWAKPKAERRALINAVLRMGVNAIFCFRAKPKLKMVKGKDPIPLGWQPIAGEEFVFEMTINCLLYPNTGGVPVWKPEEKGEGVMIKRPDKLIPVFQDGQPLSEDTGEKLARWAEGDSPNGKIKESDSASVKVGAGLIAAAETQAELDAALLNIKDELAESAGRDGLQTLRGLAQARRAALKSAASDPSEPKSGGARTGDPAASADDHRTAENLDERGGFNPTDPAVERGEPGQPDSAPSDRQREIDPETGEIIPDHVGRDSDPDQVSML